MSLPLQSNTRFGNDIPVSRDDASSPQGQTEQDDESNTRSRPRPSRKRRSTSASEAASPTSSPRSYKILKGVARKGYFEDRYRVYGAYPSDEEREGGSVPCESDSDGPTLEKSPRARKKMLSTSASPSVKSREKKSLGKAMAFAKLKAEYELKKSRGEATLVDDARFERAEIKEMSRLDDLDREKTTRRESPGKATVSAHGRHGLFGRTQPSPRKPSPETQSVQKTRSKEAESGVRGSSTHSTTETQPRVPLSQRIAELKEVYNLPRLPTPYRTSRFWEGCDVDPSPELMAQHWKYIEQLAEEGKEDFQTRIRQFRPSTGSSPLSSPPVTTPEDSNTRQSPERRASSSQDVSLGKQAFIDHKTGEVIIPRDVLKEKLRELAGELGISADIMASTDGASTKSPAQPNIAPNVAQKRVNEGPPEGTTETAAKKVRMDSANSSGESDDGSDISATDRSDDDEVRKTTRESRASSSAWVRRSKRRFSNVTPLYKADRHPADEFLKTSSPKAQDENAVNSTQDESEDDDVVALWPRKSPPPQPRTPVKPVLVKSPSSSNTPKKRGRQPGTRVVNGKVVFPSEHTTPAGPKSLAEPSSATNKTTPTLQHSKFDFSATTVTAKRTPVPSEKARAKAVDSKSTAAKSEPKKTAASSLDPKKSNTPSAAPTAKRSLVLSEKTRAKAVDSKSTAAQSEREKRATSSLDPKKSNTPSAAPTAKRTPVPSEKARAKAVNSKSTAAQSEREKRATSSLDPKKSNTPSVAPTPMKIVNGFLRGGTENEFESSSEVSLENNHGEKKKVSFPLPPIRTPSGSLNRRLFRP